MDNRSRKWPRRDATTAFLFCVHLVFPSAMYILGSLAHPHQFDSIDWHGESIEARANDAVFLAHFVLRSRNNGVDARETSSRSRGLYFGLAGLVFREFLGLFRYNRCILVTGIVESEAYERNC